MSEHHLPHLPRRSPRSAPDASRHNAQSTEPPVQSYSPSYPNYHSNYPHSSIDSQPFGYPQFYQQGSHSPDPSLVLASGRSNYQPLVVHSQSPYPPNTYPSDGSSSFAPNPPRNSGISTHHFPPAPTPSGLGSGGAGVAMPPRSSIQSSPPIFPGTNQHSTVPHYPPHTLQGTQYSYSPHPYPSSPHQVFSPPAQYHATPVENEHGQHVGWWYRPVPAGMSMATGPYERMPYQYPQYLLPFNLYDQRYSPTGPMPVASSGGQSNQGTPRRGTINITNPSSPSTTTTPPILRRSDSAPMSPQYAQGNKLDLIPHQTGQAPSSSNPTASAAPRPPARPQQDKSTTRRPYHPNPPASRSEWVMWVGNIPTDATEDELWQFFSSPSPTEKEHPATLLPPSVQAYSRVQSQPLTAAAAGSSSYPPAPLDNPSSSRSSPSSGSRPSTATTSQSATGIISIFLISRSSCAFVNYEDEPRLRNAIARFNGKVLRPRDPKCPKLVCRERKKEDDLKAGVGAQRGTGIHTQWIKEQKVKGSSLAPTASSEETPRRPPPKPLQDGPNVESHEDERPQSYRSKQRRMSSGSYTSTTSSLLTRYFPKRYFILKSLTQYDVDLSVKEGLWATQKHNEGVLDQAYRTSQDVYLIFSVNKSGEFYGYARMTGPIRGGQQRVSWASRTPSSSRSPLTPAGSGSAKGSDSSSEDGGQRLAPQSAASVPLPPGGSASSEAAETAHSMPELSDTKHPAAAAKRPFLSSRDSKVLAESPRPIDDEEGEGPPLPTIKEEPSPGSTPPPGHDGQRHTYPPNLVPRLRDDIPHPTRQSCSAPPEFAGTVRAFGEHTLYGPRSEEDIRRLELAAPPLRQVLKLDPLAPVRARRSPQESPDGERGLKQAEADSSDDVEVGAEEDADADADADKVKELATNSDQVPQEAAIPPGAPRAEGTMREEAWGEPFKIEWLCLQPLSFQRTRQIRNPWNHDREVKVSRDGTELEPVVGQKLLDEFAKLVEERQALRARGEEEEGEGQETFPVAATSTTGAPTTMTTTKKIGIRHPAEKGGDAHRGGEKA